MFAAHLSATFTMLLLTPISNILVGYGPSCVGTTGITSLQPKVMVQENHTWTIMPTEGSSRWLQTLRPRLREESDRVV